MFIRQLSIVLVLVSFSCTTIAQSKTSKKQRKEQKKTEKFEAIKTSFENATFTFEVKSISVRGSHIKVTSNATGRGIVKVYGDKVNAHLATIKAAYTNNNPQYLETEMNINNYVISYLDQGRKVQASFVSTYKGNTYEYRFSATLDGDYILKLEGSDRETTMYTGKLKV